MARSHQQRAIRGLSIAEISCGFVCLVLGIVILFLSLNKSEPLNVFVVGNGIWCGGWIIITSIIGVVASGMKTSISCVIHTFIIFSLVGAGSCAATVGIGVMIFTGSVEYGVEPGDDIFYLFCFVFVLTSILSILMLINVLYSCFMEGSCCRGKTQRTARVSNQKQFQSNDRRSRT